MGDWKRWDGSIFTCSGAPWAWSSACRTWQAPRCTGDLAAPSHPWEIWTRMVSMVRMRIVGILAMKWILRHDFFGCRGYIFPPIWPFVRCGYKLSVWRGGSAGTCLHLQRILRRTQGKAISGDNWPVGCWCDSCQLWIFPQRSQGPWHEWIPRWVRFSRRSRSIAFYILGMFSNSDSLFPQI